MPEACTTLSQCQRMALKPHLGATIPMGPCSLMVDRVAERRVFRSCFVGTGFFWFPQFANGCAAKALPKGLKSYALKAFGSPTNLQAESVYPMISVYTRLRDSSCRAALSGLAGVASSLLYFVSIQSLPKAEPVFYIHIYIYIDLHVQRTCIYADVSFYICICICKYGGCRKLGALRKGFYQNDTHKKDHPKL